MLKSVSIMVVAAAMLQGCGPAGVGLLLVPDEVIVSAVDSMAGTNNAAMMRVAKPLEGNDCVPENFKVGSRVHKGGKTFGTVKEIYGTSPNCPYADMPLRALVLVD